MATKDDLRAIAGKALVDPEFRQKLSEDPEAAVKEVGIELTPDQIKALKEMDKEQFQTGLADLDERLTMSCWGYVRDIIGQPSSPEITDTTPITIPETCTWR